MKKLFAFALSMVLTALFITGCANNTVNEKKEVVATELPSKFDLRNAGGKNYVTPVKCQSHGDCWTFAMAGAAETAYLYANELGVPTGEKNEKVNFSEKYITWYMFHGMTKDDVVKGKVRASQVGEGFDPKEAEEADKMAAYSFGGPFVSAANLFGCGFGPVDESAEVNGEYPYAYDAEASVEWQLPLNAEYRSAPVAALFKDSRVLPTPSKIDADGNYAFNQEGVDAIKKEICQGHGVIVALNAAHPGFNNPNRAVYDNSGDEPNHAVLVVGYDDDFPKDKFTRKRNPAVRLSKERHRPQTAQSSSRTAGASRRTTATPTTATFTSPITTPACWRR